MQRYCYAPRFGWISRVPKTGGKLWPWSSSWENSMGWCGGVFRLKYSGERQNPSFSWGLMHFNNRQDNLKHPFLMFFWTCFLQHGAFHQPISVDHRIDTIRAPHCSILAALREFWRNRWKLLVDFTQEKRNSILVNNWKILGKNNVSWGYPIEIEANQVKTCEKGYWCWRSHCKPTQVTGWRGLHSKQISWSHLAIEQEHGLLDGPSFSSEWLAAW